ncbi:MAG: hypothetical protein AB1427_20895 [Thermodesulfobacteriota bacterium]
MKKIARHLLIPAAATVIFFIIAFLPAEFLACRNRGQISVCIALAAGLLGIFAAVEALISRVRGDENSVLWMASALILAIPAIFIVLDAA